MIPGGHIQRIFVPIRRLGEDHETDMSFNNLAVLYANQGKYEQAELLLRRTLIAMEKRWGPEHPNIVLGLLNLATLGDHQSKYEEVELLYRRALAIAESFLQTKRSAEEHRYRRHK